MFLTPLVADAAAQHGHEFSAPRPATPSRLSPIPRSIRPQSALAKARPAPTAMARGLAGELVPPAQLGRPEKVMFKEEAEVKLVERLRRSLEESSEEEAQQPSTTGTALVGDPTEARSAKQARKGKKEQQPKTTYTFAHTAARVNALHKLKSRPPAVLQLHKVTPGSRPVPAFEVYPPGRYAKKLGRDLARLHKGKDRLGADDVVVCKALAYDAPEDDWESQGVLGIVCASCKDESHASGNAQLCLEDGSTWEAVPQAKGRFDFIATDDYGNSRVVRWVPRRVRSKQKPASGASTSLANNPSPVEEVVYRFSTIDPQTRRHPVIATMRPTDLEISDSYYMPRKVVQEPTFDDSTIITPDEEPGPQLGEDQAERDLIHTAPLLRSLILLSGIYVALCNNWSPVFTYRKEGAKGADGTRMGSCSNSVRSPNASPTPSADRVPLGTTRRNTFTFHRRSSTAATTSATSMSTALSGGFGENQSADHSLPSRSTTPESRRRRTDSTVLGVMRSATDRFVDRNRQQSTTTESGESTTAEGSEYSLPDGTRTPTPSTRLGAIDGGAEHPDPVRRATTSSSGLLQRASSLKKHWRMPSNPRSDIEFVGYDGANDAPSAGTSTPAPNEEGSASTRRRRFSLSRGRARQRPDKTLSMVDDRPPAAYHNPQWWMNWGSEEPVTRPESATIVPAAPATPEPRTASGLLEPGMAATPQRRSFSIASWRRREPAERPRSVFVTAPAAADDTAGADDKLALQSLRVGPVQDKEDTGLSGLVHRVTHRLRREERRLH